MRLFATYRKRLYAFLSEKAFPCRKPIFTKDANKNLVMILTVRKGLLSLNPFYLIATLFIKYLACFVRSENHAPNLTKVQSVKCIVKENEFCFGGISPAPQILFSYHCFRVCGTTPPLNGVKTNHTNRP